MEWDFQKEFLKQFNKLTYRHSSGQIWDDFLYLSAVSLANTMPGPEHEEREREYVRRAGGYNKEAQEIFSQLLGLVVLAFEDNPGQDFQGNIYQGLGLGQRKTGQCFTPYNVCQLMAEIQFSKKGPGQQDKDYISVNDPACGAGALLIAFANAAKAHGMNYQREVLFVAQDTDRTAALMCYVQLGILGCPAIVIAGDSLARPGIHPDNEVWLTPFYHFNSWGFNNFLSEEENQGQEKEDIRIPNGPGLPEEENGQLSLPFFRPA